MKNKKKMTPKALAANRNNSKSSTGPRTQRGKDFARFNAVKHGLFASEILIPLCDGVGAGSDFRKLLRDLYEEYQPDTIFQTSLVEIIAQGLWRLRRGARAEHGSTRMAALWNRCLLPTPDSYVKALTRFLGRHEAHIATLNKAREEIQSTGTLSDKTYARVVPLVEEQQPTQAKMPETTQPLHPVIGDDFTQHLEEKKSTFEAEADRIRKALASMMPDRLAASALPPGEETDKILRFESGVRKQLDWALKKLLQSQARRKKTRRRSSRVPKPSSPSRRQTQ